MLNPLKLVSELEQVLSDKSILIGDGGDFIATAACVTDVCVCGSSLSCVPHGVMLFPATCCARVGP